MFKTKCICCNQKLKPGEFITLNGGAMIRTRSGAKMGGKNLLGFLTVNSHFDSKQNYRSIVITDNGPNGQFELYACSHKCLAEYISRQIMHLRYFNKYKKIIMLSDKKLQRVGSKWCDEVLRQLGFKNALITDESTISDFIPLYSNLEQVIKKYSKRLGFPVVAQDRIWQVAKRLKDSKS